MDKDNAYQVGPTIWARPSFVFPRTPEEVEKLLASKNEPQVDLPSLVVIYNWATGDIHISAGDVEAAVIIKRREWESIQSYVESEMRRAGERGQDGGRQVREGGKMYLERTLKIGGQHAIVLERQESTCWEDWNDTAELPSCISRDFVSGRVDEVKEGPVATPYGAVLVSARQPLANVKGGMECPSTKLKIFIDRKYFEWEIINFFPQENKDLRDVVMKFVDSARNQES